jgi:hypothetical protein
VSRYDWFPRLAAIPGVNYAGHPDIDRTKLPGHCAKPRIQTLSFGGETHVSAMWNLPDGGATSQSPAAGWSSTDLRGSPAGFVRRVYEALELPGAASDYHFALLRAYEELWSMRRGEPEILAELERLCLLDIALVEARPEIIGYTGAAKGVASRVPAFEHLVFLYEGEGFLKDALDIARRAAACGQGTQDVERLEARIHDEP